MAQVENPDVITREIEANINKNKKWQHVMAAIFYCFISILSIILIISSNFMESEQDKLNR